MGIAFAWFVKHDEALPLPGEWFIGVEILRKSVLTPIQYPLDRAMTGGSLSNEYKSKTPIP